MKKLIIILILALMVNMWAVMQSEDEECFTDICITERTGDIDPADPYYEYEDQHILFDEDL